MLATINKSKDQPLELFMSLSSENLQAVLEYSKMRLYVQELDLPAEQIPSIDEWEAASTAVRKLLVLAIDRLTIAKGAYSHLLTDHMKLKENMKCSV